MADTGREPADSGRVPSYDELRAEVEHLRSVLEAMKRTEPADYIRQLEVDRDASAQAAALLRAELEERAREAAQHRELLDAAARSLARAHDGVVVMGPDEKSWVASFVDELSWLRNEAARLRDELSELRADYEHLLQSRIDGGDQLHVEREHAEAEAAHVQHLNAQLRRENEQLRDALRDVLGHFTERGHPGRPCLRTPWLSVETVQQWRGLLARDQDPGERNLRLSELSPEAREQAERIMDGAAERRAAVRAGFEQDDLPADFPRCPQCDEPLLNEGRVCLTHGWLEGEQP